MGAGDAMMPGMTPPPDPLHFETQRLLLRPRTLSDTDACIAMNRDPEVTRFVGGPWLDACAHHAFIQQRTLGPWPAGMGYWTILSRGDAPTFVGWILLLPIDAVGPEIEIGWRLRRRFWGKGLATEAARAVLAHAFENLRVSEVVALIDPENHGSAKVAEKIGLKQGRAGRHAGKPVLRYALKAAEASTGSPTQK